MSEQTNPENTNEHPVNEEPSHEVPGKEDVGQAGADELSMQNQQVAAAARAREDVARQQMATEVSARDRKLEETGRINKVLSVLVALLVITVAGQIYFMVREHQRFTALDRQRRVVERQLYAPLSYYNFPSHSFGRANHTGNAAQTPTLKPWLITGRDISLPNSGGDLSQLQDEMIQMVNQSFGINPHVKSQNFAFSPGLDLQDHKDHYTVTMDVRGIKPSAIKVKVENQTLTVSGANDQMMAKKNDKGQIILNEQEKGSFETDLRLPEPVQTDKMKTEYSHNKLIVTLPKAAATARISKTSNSVGREA